MKKFIDATIYKKIYMIERILPWLVLVGGIPSIFFWNASSTAWYADRMVEYERYSNLLEIFHTISLGTGVIVVLAEVIFGSIALVGLMVDIIKKSDSQENKAVKKRIFWSSGGLVILTLFLMLLVQGFTYGQGV